MGDGIILQTPFASSNDVNAAHLGSAPSVFSIPSSQEKQKKTKKNKYLQQYGPSAFMIVLLIVILILAAVIVSKLNSSAAIAIDSSGTSTPSMFTPFSAETSEGGLPLAQSINVEHMLTHLRQFESRAIGTPAFNRTMDYLTNQLNQANAFTVQKYYFAVPRSELNGSPSLMALPNISNASIFTYPRDFVTMERSAEARNWSWTNGRPLAVVGRYGCSLADWNMTKEGDVALVRRGICTFTQKIFLAMSKRASACLIYNDGLTIDRLGPLNNTRAPSNNTLPALFLSYEAGMRLILENTSRIYLRLEIRSLPPAIVTNVCADTKSGDINRTIVIGSHSDSVAAGNDFYSNQFL